MNLQHFGQICEAAMLFAFGLSWPISIMKSWRLKFVRGKSLGFLLLILVGYISGTIAKFLKAAHADAQLEHTTWLYILNGILVGIDLILYMKYRNNPEPASPQATTIE